MRDPVERDEGAQADHDDGTADDVDREFGKGLPVVDRPGPGGHIRPRLGPVGLRARETQGFVEHETGQHCGERREQAQSGEPAQVHQRHDQDRCEQVAGIAAHGKDAHARARR